MATYSDKLNDSFITKLKIFLFTKSFEENIMDYIKKSKKEIRKEFKEFELTSKIANIYSAQYYQYDEDIEIVLSSERIKKSADLVKNLMDKKKYIISTPNLKFYLHEIYDDLKKDYEKDGNFMSKNDFKILLNSANCEYCGISEEQIKFLGEHAQLNNKRSETRGYTLEIDRKEPNLEYTKENCCMSCYWCNNAKTDEFLPSEFKEIARGINIAWNQRLKKSHSTETIYFKKNSNIWKP